MTEPTCSCVCACACGCSPAGRLPGAPDLGRVCLPVAGGGGFRPGHGGAVRQAQCLPAGGAAEPGQPLRAPLPRGAQDQAQVRWPSHLMGFFSSPSGDTWYCKNTTHERKKTCNAVRIADGTSLN